MCKSPHRTAAARRVAAQPARQRGGLRPEGETAADADRMRTVRGPHDKMQRNGRGRGRFSLWAPSGRVLAWFHQRWSVAVGPGMMQHLFET
eukprot:gene17238-biopygen5322